MQQLPPLSAGAVEANMRPGAPFAVTGAILQVVQMRPIASNKPGAPPVTTDPSTERWRGVLSDGIYGMNVIFASALVPSMRQKVIEKNTVIRVDNSMDNMVNDTRLPIILSATVLGQSPTRIGEPQQWPTKATAGAGAAHQQPPPQQQHQQAASSYVPATPAAAYAPPTTSTGGYANTSNYGASATNSYGAPATTTATATSSYASGGGYASTAGGGGYGSSTATPAAPSSSTSTLAGRPTQSIASLSPYVNAWCIRGRVTQKGDMKHYTNARGEGHLFNFTIADESCDIRVTLFNQDADRYFEQIKEGRVYLVQSGRVNPANRRFNSTQSEYEITAERATVIEEVTDARIASAIPAIQLNPVPIADLAQVEPNTTADVLGIVTDIGPLSTIVSKATQRELTKRDVTLADQSAYSVRLTLWGKQAENVTFHEGQVLGVRHAKVGDFGGRSLSTLMSSTLAANPDLPEAHALQGWWDAQGSTMALMTHQGAGGGGGAGGMGGGMGGAGMGAADRNDVTLLCDVQDPAMGATKPEYYTTDAYITFIRPQNMMYPACQSEGCSKKVTFTGSGWRCEKCSVEHDAPEYRYIMTINVTDATGQVWLQAFNEAAQTILGKTASELNYLKEANPAEHDQVVQEAMFRPMRFRVRVKQETFQDEARARHAIMECQHLDVSGQAVIQAALAAKKLVAMYDGQ
ncbi:Replication factor A protein 1 [Allomyces javanicus]|nr:Replication factor A protein 1 [Allomyces javanicus]